MSNDSDLAEIIWQGFSKSPFVNIARRDAESVAATVLAAGYVPADRLAAVEAEREFWKSERWAAQSLVVAANAELNDAVTAVSQVRGICCEVAEEGGSQVPISMIFEAISGPRS